MAKLLIQGADKKAVKKILLALTKDIIAYCIKQKIMEEFLKQKLDIKYQKEIEEWFVYLDQKEYGENLKKRILAEIEKYIAGKKTIEELVDEMFETEIHIEFLTDEEISINTARVLFGVA